MGIIANQMAVELFFKIKEKFKVKKEEKKQQKRKVMKKVVLIDASQRKKANSEIIVDEILTGRHEMTAEGVRCLD